MALYEDLQERLEDVSIYSNYFAALCVFHSDNSPSMFVYEDLDKPEDRRWFKCSACGEQGNHAKLWRKVTGTSAQVKLSSVTPTKKFLPQWTRWERQFNSIENLVNEAHENVRRFSNMDWYIKKRKLEDVYEPCKLGYLDEWLFLPIFDPQGRIIDVIVRDTKGRSKYVIHPNEEATPLLYVPNWKRVMDAKLVYIVYGLIDALALEMCGLPAISGTTGKSLSNKRLAQLNKKYVIIPDKCEESDARNLAMALGNFTKVLRLDYPEDCKDPDEVRMKYGIHYIKRLIIF